MNPWFFWKGQNSYSNGLWISKLPKITRPEERITHVNIPGRPGELTLTEGDEVYNAYKKDIVVTCPNENFSPALLDWLRGDGELIVCTEPQYVYRARIASEVSFARVGNNLMQATISFWCQPFKYSSHPADDQLSLLNGVDGVEVIYNPGNAISKPKITLQRYGGTYLAIGDRHMQFEHAPETLYIDCDAETIICPIDNYNPDKYYYRGDYSNAIGLQDYETGMYRYTQEGWGREIQWEYVDVADTTFQYAWPGKWTGDFLRIMPGSNNVTTSNDTQSTQRWPVIIDPNWRWL